MAKIKGTIVIDVDRCKGCSVCIVNCPFKILEMSNRVNHKGYFYPAMTDADRCTGCASCAEVCPDSCITVYRKKVE